MRVSVTIAKGDGIGPEIMDAVLLVLREAGADLDYQFVEIGEQAYRAGHTSGIPPEAWEVIRRNPVFLKAPITTPEGKGYKSLNVTIRKTLGLFANVRPARTFDPVIPSRYPGMDVVVIRENEEDLYAGVEYRPSPGTVVAWKQITREASERIIRFAFAYARANGRKKVTAMTKDNILKLSDGLFHRVFEEVARDYPDLEAEHWIIDIGAAKLADQPQLFDVVVLPNLYGDILSDVTAQMAGSVGVAGSANIGEKYAMFEAIHGSAPRHAGKNIANPSALLQAAVMMLVHIGQTEVAERIQNAWLRTLEERTVTYDLARKLRAEGLECTELGTREFAEAVVRNLGKEPETLEAVRYQAVPMAEALRLRRRPPEEMRIVGVDVGFPAPPEKPAELGDRIRAVTPKPFRLHLLQNRGQKVYPGDPGLAHLGDYWVARFYVEGNGSPDLEALLGALRKAGIAWNYVQTLEEFAGQRGYTLAQGE